MDTNVNVATDTATPNRLTLVRHLVHILLSCTSPACSKLCARYLWYVLIHCVGTGCSSQTKGHVSIVVSFVFV